MRIRVHCWPPVVREDGARTREGIAPYPLTYVVQYNARLLLRIRFLITSCVHERRIHVSFFLSHSSCRLLYSAPRPSTGRTRARREPTPSDAARTIYRKPARREVPPLDVVLTPPLVAISTESVRSARRGVFRALALARARKRRDHIFHSGSLLFKL